MDILQETCGLLCTAAMNVHRQTLYVYTYVQSSNR